MNKPIFGIIGGAGVAASNLLNCMIEEHLTKMGAFRDAHHPEVITYQAVNVPSRSMFLEGRGPSFIPGYIEIGNKLKIAGATTMAMCCNTAHYAIEELQQEIDVPFIDMVELAILEIKKLYSGKKIGLIASDGCLLGKVYEKRFDKHYPNAMLVYPKNDFQALVTKGIVNIKNRSRFLTEEHIDRPKTIFQTVCQHLKENGAEVIIIGCTDIAVDFLPENYPDIPILDSLSLLADKILSIFNEYSITIKK